MKIDISAIDYSALDRSEVIHSLFYPRPETPASVLAGPSGSVLIPVEEGIAVGARFHLSGATAPSILFFHGNGEIVADYDDIATVYTGMGINFLPVDYRGYGRSTGNPTVTAMMRDCHVAFDYVRNWLGEHGHTGPFVVMGRSLGSAPALELACHYGDAIDGLIVESGFADAEPLLELLGLSLEYLGITEKEGFRNTDKIRSFDKPTLIIHAQRDHIIPVEEGQRLFDTCPARAKRLLIVPGAGHNDIFYRGMADYLDAVKWLMEEASACGSCYNR